jgi:hypothetical protein
MFGKGTGLTILFAAAAAAAPAVDSADVRCFLVTAEMADTKDKEVETAASIMMFYYLGRIDGKDPAANIEALVEQEAARLTDAEKKQLLATCSAQVERRGKQLSGGGAS